MDAIENRMVEMSDGVRLMTHFFFPKTAGPWPVIVYRTPYVPQLRQKYPTFETFAANGYAVVCQECRGQGQSEGVWIPLVNERQDGLDTLHFITGQSWADGNIGLTGNSYMSLVHLSMADSLPPQVKAMYLSAFAVDMHRVNYRNGMFKHGVFTNFLLGMDCLFQYEEDAFAKLYHDAAMFKPAMEADKRFTRGEAPWYRAFLAAESPADKFWRQGFWGRLLRVPEKINVPVVFTSGWFDGYCDTLPLMFSALKEDVRAKSRLVMGPWGHQLVPVGDYTSFENAVYGGIDDELEWFGHWLCGRPYGKELGVAETYAIGKNEWQVHREWPVKAGTRRFYPAADASLGYKGGSLCQEPGEEESTLAYTYDPKDPVPTKGGYYLYAPNTAPGSVLQPQPGWRHDVLTFLTPPLAEDLCITGGITAVMFVSSDAADTAFSVKVSEAFPNGETYNIREGISSLAWRGGGQEPAPYTPGEIVHVEIELPPLVWNVQKGSRLRLDISSSDFPAFHAHSNMAGPWAFGTETCVAAQKVYTGGAYPSFLEIPVP